MIGMRWLLRLVSEKPSPRLIPMSSNRKENLRRDYFSLELVPVDGGSPFLFSRLRWGFVIAKEWNAAGHVYQKRRAFKMTEMAAFKPSVRFYFRQFEFRFKEAWKLWLFYTMNVHRVYALFSWLSQVLYNRRSLSTVERTEVM
jgi:hypothetical protein